MCPPWIYVSLFLFTSFDCLITHLGSEAFLLSPLPCLHHVAYTGLYAELRQRTPKQAKTAAQIMHWHTGFSFFTAFDQFDFSFPQFLPRDSFSWQNDMLKLLHEFVDASVRFAFFRKLFMLLNPYRWMLYCLYHQLPSSCLSKIFSIIFFNFFALPNIPAKTRKLAKNFTLG